MATGIAATDVKCPRCSAIPSRLCYPTNGQSRSYSGRGSHGERIELARSVRLQLAAIPVPPRGREEPVSVPATPGCTPKCVARYKALASESRALIGSALVSGRRTGILDAIRVVSDAPGVSEGIRRVIAHDISCLLNRT